MVARLRVLKIHRLSKKLLLQILAVLVVLYASFAGLVVWAMRQPPETFGRVMAHMPGPVPFLIFPFETAWLRARAGHLRPGDPAPDFWLITQNKSGAVHLAALTSQGPVVLVFGSYT